MQCFDAFSMAPVDNHNSDSDEDCSDLTAQPWFFALVTLLVAALSLLLGVLLVSYGVLTCFKSQKQIEYEKVGGVDRSNFLTEENPIR
jgi:hypothetical protein